MADNITFRNNRHGTRVSVNAEPQTDNAWYWLTKQQVSYIRSCLCHRHDCNCGQGPAKLLKGDDEDNPRFYPAKEGRYVHVSGRGNQKG